VQCEIFAMISFARTGLCLQQVNFNKNGISRTSETTFGGHVYYMRVHVSSLVLFLLRELDLLINLDTNFLKSFWNRNELPWVNSSPSE